MDVSSAASGYYVTTPIYYVNDVPHLGHAYTTIACDTLARFMRLDGRDVRFTTGTDEHGQKVAKSAAAAGLDPAAFTDRVSERFRSLIDAVGAAPSDFIRTTEERHYRSVHEIWRRLVQRDEIYAGKYEGWYSVRDEAYLAEGELVRQPDGTFRAASGAPAEWVAEPSYFFRLSRWQEPLLRWYAAHPDFVGPASRRNEIVRFVEGGLEDLSVSRTTFRWGVPVPDDSGHVIYVWFDALTNYLTSAGFPDEHCRTYDRFWPADLHVVGKDIVRFHAVYWPAMLLAAGLRPPHRVFAHGWWTVEGRKMSKSIGNVVDPFRVVKEFGVDQVRYFLLREVPFGQDGDYSRAAMIHRANADLANDYGNLVQRVLTLVQRSCGGVVPERGAAAPEDGVLLRTAAGLGAELRPLMETQQMHAALRVLWDVIRAANTYVDRAAPWALARTDADRCRTVLSVLLETVRRIAVFSQPFVPVGSAAILDQLAVPADRRRFGDADWNPAPGTPLAAPRPVFPRLAPGPASHAG